MQETMEMIRLVQSPVIEERLAEVKAAVTARVQAVASMSCTEETVQYAKKARSELNKEFESLEAQRKAVKAKCMAPYDAMLAAYKECIAAPYQEADKQLKNKIDGIERGQKIGCELRLQSYFTELCQRERLDWLSYDRAGITVDLTSAKQKTPQKLMDRLSEFVARVATERDAINRLPDADEILVEYRRCLNMAQAVETVRQRREAVERMRQESEREAAAEAAQSAAVARVEAAAPVVVERMEPAQPPTDAATQDGPVLRCTFTVTATRAKLKKLKEFLIQEEIPYVN